jgi:hypothetical protein
MPIRPENKSRYPKDWKEISQRIKMRAGNKCEWCGAENGAPHPVTREWCQPTVRGKYAHVPTSSEEFALRKIK